MAVRGGGRGSRTTRKRVGGGRENCGKMNKVTRKRDGRGRKNNGGTKFAGYLKRDKTGLTVHKKVALSDGDVRK